MSLSVKTRNLLRKMCEQVCYYSNSIIESWLNRKYVIFCAGPSGVSFYHLLRKEFGIEAEFFIDNDKSLNGSTTCGREIKYEPWNSDPGFSDKYCVIVASSWRNFESVQKQLLPFIMKLNVMSWYTYYYSRILTRIFAVADRLDDDESETAYWASIYSMITGDNQFIQYTYGQYFAHKRFAIPENEIIVDAGAYVGDSIEAYVVRSLGIIEKIYAFEPFEGNIIAIKARVKRLCSEWLLDNERIEIIPFGLGSGNDVSVKYVPLSGGMMFMKGAGDISVPTISIDDYFTDKKPPTLIKADIEGMEMDMLKGAEQILIKNKPKLAISIYHTPMDLVMIPEYINNLGLNYQFAVRNHHTSFVDTVLYAWVEE